MDKKKIIGLAILVIVVAGLILAGYFYWKKVSENKLNQNPASSDPIKNAATQGVLPSINPQSNPMEKSPDINPAQNANPFANVKTNPFQ